MTDQTDPADESAHGGPKLTRRSALIASLGAAGLIGAAASQSTSSSGSVGIGGGPMANEISHLQFDWYEGPESDLPAAGSEGRFFRVTADGSTYSKGDVLRDDGDTWNKIPLGVGSLNTDLIESGPRHLKTQNKSLERWRARGESVDGFENDPTTRWSTGSSSTDAYVGSESLKITHSGSVTSTEQSISLDATGKTPSLAVKCNSTDSEARMFVILEDSAGNQQMFLTLLRDGNNPRGGADWTRHDWGFYQEDTGFDATDVSKVILRTQGMSDNDETWVDDFRLVDTPDKGYFMFIFDDGHTSHYSGFRPILEKYNYPAAAAVPTDLVGQSGQMSWGQLRELQDDYGWDVVAHSTDHTTEGSMSQSEIEDRYDIAKRALLDNGIHGGEPGDVGGADVQVYPGNVYNENVLQAANNYFKLAFTGHSRVWYNPVNPATTTPLSLMRGGSSLSDWQDIADQAAEHNLLGATIIHDTGDEISLSDFESLVDHVQSKDNLEVITPSQLWEITTSSPDNERFGDTTHDKVRTPNLDIGASDFVASGDFVPLRDRDVLENRQFGTASTSYAHSVNQSNWLIQWDRLPSDAQSAVVLEGSAVPGTDETVDVRLRNVTDGETAVEKTGITATENFSIKSNYTPTTTTSPVIFRAEIRTDPGSNSSQLDQPGMSVGIQL